MKSHPISTSNGKCCESAPEPAKHWREPFDELRKSFQEFDLMLGTLLASDSGASLGVPAYSLPESPSEAT